MDFTFADSSRRDGGRASPGRCDLRQRGSLPTGLVPRQEFLPGRQLRAQLVQIQIGERCFGALEIAQRSRQYGSRPYAIAGRLMMKCDRDLHQSLEMPPQRAVPRRFPPDVFEGLVGVEEARRVKQGEAVAEVSFMQGIR
jgi:hypothetical protein